MVETLKKKKIKKDVEQIDFKNENASMVVGSNHWVFN